MRSSSAKSQAESALAVFELKDENSKLLEENARLLGERGRRAGVVESNVLTIQGIAIDSGGVLFIQGM